MKKDKNEELISPLERWQQEKKRNNFKMITSLVLSNLLTFFICMPNEPQKRLVSKIQKSKDYSIVKLKAVSHVRQPIQRKVKVTLLDKSGNIITNAFLWPNLKHINSDTQTLEIPNIFLATISRFSNENINIYPRLFATKKKERNHEINF